VGPIGLPTYVLADKDQRSGEHKAFMWLHWKQHVGLNLHYVAGDAAGLILAAAITALLGLPMQIDFIIEYLACLTSSLSIFQSLFMKSMMGAPTGARQEELHTGNNQHDLHVGWRGSGHELPEMC